MRLPFRYRGEGSLNWKNFRRPGFMLRGMDLELKDFRPREDKGTEARAFRLTQSAESRIRLTLSLEQ